MYPYANRNTGGFHSLRARKSAEALRGALRGRLHIRNSQPDMKSVHGSPLKALHGRGGQEGSMLRFSPLPRKRQDPYHLLSLS